ncbi:alpha/beta hydrolase [Cohnella rhizosphaerae]|uniref:Alpha/beta hydrolase n=1 Tax=Cohnella rhizosphaerae TaxID=1457232 RepID=A0A9X4KTH1_9BACL|nr:alpha/beta hydrolase [Cohnella rhizosphaerae]MDG0810515.1 alpha/beta hydrolase [Cohnella rhizosphaerae]
MSDNGWPIETVIYKEANGARLKLLVCKPEGWHEADGRSAVVWIHGGGWHSGAPEQFLRHSRMMADRGAVSFSVAYRLLPSPGTPDTAGRASSLEDCMADCRSAIRFIRTNASRFGIRPDRIAVVGDSAGGHLAASLAFGPAFGLVDGCDSEQASVDADREVSARADLIVDCNGIVDLTGKWKQMIPARSPVAGCEDDAVHAWMERHERAKTWSPLYRVSAGQPPMLILHGLADDVVASEDAVRFYETYRSAGNDAELALYPGWRHAFILFDYKAAETEVLRAMGRIEAFLARHGY